MGEEKVKLVPGSKIVFFGDSFTTVGEVVNHVDGWVQLKNAYDLPRNSSPSFRVATGNTDEFVPWWGAEVWINLDGVVRFIGWEHELPEHDA
jgi:hypothetical protein